MIRENGIGHKEETMELAIFCRDFPIRNGFTIENRQKIEMDGVNYINNQLNISRIIRMIENGIIGCHQKWQIQFKFLDRRKFLDHSHEYPSSIHFSFPLRF
jgi:hypothetical protein